jgi:Glycosyltransferases involved in cell wall biogenesis
MQNDKYSIDISIVMLCYQSGEHIRSFVDKVIKLIDAVTPCWELILVANYLSNTDDVTPEVVKDIASKNKNVKYIARVKQGMMGWDAISGLNEATGRYLCLVDGDGQVPADDIIKVYRNIKKNGLDLVKTYRVVRYDGLTRVFISNVYTLLLNLMFPGTYVRDINSKPKIFTKEVYDKMHLLSDDWFLDAEMMIRAKRVKLRIGEVPSIFYKCLHRKSLVRLSAIFEFITNLLKARFTKSAA